MQPLRRLLVGACAPRITAWSTRSAIRAAAAPPAVWCAHRPCSSSSSPTTPYSSPAAEQRVRSRGPQRQASAPNNSGNSDRAWQQQQQQPGQPQQQQQHPRHALPPYDGVPLPTLRQLMNRKDYGAIEAFVDAHFNPERQSLLQFCGHASDARDVVLSLMRVYVALGRMEKVRRIFLVACRDLPSPPVADAAHDADVGSSPSTRPSLMNTSVFNGYLEALTRRKNYDKDEVIFVLQSMQEHGVRADALTYHFLMELHIRAGYDPKPLWDEAFHERRLQPLPATVQAVLLRVVPYSTDGAFVIEVVREALTCGSTVLDKRTLAELIESGLRDGPRSLSHNAHANASAANTTAAGGPPAPSSSTAAGSTRFPPEVVMWLMLELEVRCVLDKASFVQYIQKQHIAELLLRCAKAADATTTAEVLALMDRHVMTKTADVLSLVVWCWAQAGELEKAFDMVEFMARKGYLELTDALRKYHVDCLRYTMDRHFLMILADAVATAPLYERVCAHLRARRAGGLVVSAHALDVVVLAAGKLGEERAALQLALSYPTAWGVQPRTATLNSLLLGCSTQPHQGSVLLGSLYEAMLAAGVAPNPLTFRILIRQSVLHDCVDDAVAYLEEVAKHPGLRVEVEMILPIMERAARVGDVETVNRVSKFSLDSDIGIDSVVLQNVMKYLADAGQSVEVVKGHQPLHEALRSRSKVGRQRARSELVL